jgi:hypothetical protein
LSALLSGNSLEVNFLAIARTGPVGQGIFGKGKMISKKSQKLIVWCCYL